MPAADKTARLFAAIVAAVACGVTTAGPASADPGTLMSTLPQGFSSANCQASTPKPPALERVSCDQSSESGGPLAAIFARYGNVDDLTAGFHSAAITLASTCPGNQQSPGPWTFGSSGQTGGMVECGTVSDDNGSSAVVIWTDNAKMRGAAIQGKDLSSLYQWWKTKSG